MTYVPAPDRYPSMSYRRLGRSGLRLPLISLGLWQNFGAQRAYSESREIVLRAFDLGVTHFDLANNYGPPYGSAEETFGRILATDLRPHRDDIGVKDLLDVFYIQGGSPDVVLYAITIDPQQPISMELSEVIAKAAEVAVSEILAELT